MQAGIDVNAVILDNGSSSIKFGFSTEDQPRFFYDSHIAYEPTPSSSTSQLSNPHSNYVYNASIPIYRQNKEVQDVIQNGLIQDFDAMERVWASLFAYSRIDPTNHPLLMSEPIFNTKARREKSMEIMFESFRFPQFFLAHDVSLNCFSVGKPSGLVVSMGSGQTTIAAVSSGHSLLNTAQYSKVSGDSLDALLHQLLLSSHSLDELPLSYQYHKSKNLTTGKIDVQRLLAAPISDSTRTELQGLRALQGTPSYHAYCTRLLLRDIKETCMTIPFTPYNPEAIIQDEKYKEKLSKTGFYNKNNSGMNSMNDDGGQDDKLTAEEQLSQMKQCEYVLPDGKVLNLTETGMILGESLFQPLYKLSNVNIVTDLQAPRVDLSNLSTSSTLTTLQGAVHRCILDNDADLKSVMLNNIILCGGSTLSSGLAQRLQLELSTLLTAGFKMKFTSQLTQMERKYGTWIGGSILSSLSAFAPSWIYKSEYEEFGNSILNRKIL